MELRSFPEKLPFPSEVNTGLHLVIGSKKQEQISSCFRASTFVAGLAAITICDWSSEQQLEPVTHSDKVYFIYLKGRSGEYKFQRLAVETRLMFVPMEHLI